MWWWMWGAMAWSNPVSEAAQATMENPMDPEVWAQYGDVLRERGKKKRAREAYVHALSLDSENLTARSGSAQLGNRDARKLERKVLRRPMDDELWGDLGDAYYGGGRHEDAVRAYSQAAALDPGDGEWQSALSRLMSPEDLYARMMETGMSGGDEQLGDLADMMMEQGEVERACELYTRASELDPGDTEWTNALMEYCGQGGLGMAGGLLGLDGPEMYLGGDSSSEESSAEVMVARSWLVLGDTDRALELYRAALYEDSGNGRLRAAVMLLSQSTEVELLEDLVLRLPDSDELWGDLGDAYAAVAQPEDAAGAWEKALELDTEDAEWRYKLELVDPSRIQPDPRADSIRELLESE